MALISKEVPKEKALRVAVNKLKNHSPSFSYTTVDALLIKKNQQPAYYVLNFKPEGWALISADDTALPVLGYSEYGNFETENQPITMKDWLNNYVEQIQMKEGSLNQTHDGWEVSSTRFSTKGSKISPLISINWNQGHPYNQFCPSDADGKAVVGCVAVAMAQAMSVARYPIRPNGEHSYFSSKYGTIYINYNKEDAYNWNAIISGNDGRKEVARLLYHCGVSVDMGYSPSGSGTQTSYIPAALRSYFGYSKSVKAYPRDGYTEGDWEELIQAELQAGRAVVYSGYDGVGNYGHAFNLDGYDGNHMYHVNWGWGGANNGYFAIDGLKDKKMNMNYTKNHMVVVGIRATFDGPSDIVLSNSSVKGNQPIGTAVGKVSVDSDLANQQYSYELKGSYNIILEDYNEASFEIDKNGNLLTKKVFEDKPQSYWETLYIKATNVENNLSLEKRFQITITNSQTSIDESAYNKQSILYSKGQKSIITTLNTSGELFIFTLLGTKIKENHVTSDNNSTSVMGLPKGCYIVTFTPERTKNTISKKIIIN